MTLNINRLKRKFRPRTCEDTLKGEWWKSSAVPKVIQSTKSLTLQNIDSHKSAIICVLNIPEPRIYNQAINMSTKKNEPRHLVKQNLLMKMKSRMLLKIGGIDFFVRNGSTKFEETLTVKSKDPKQGTL